MIDRLEAWFLRYILWIRDPAADPKRKRLEPEDIPWDVPLDQTTGHTYTPGESGLH